MKNIPEEPESNHSEIRSSLISEVHEHKIILKDENSIIEKDDDQSSLIEISKICLYLGITSFGGPIAHIGMFNKIFIQEKQMLTEKSFSQLFSLCNVLPGPTSSQLLTAIATVKTKSLIGGIISFFCFNMPSLIIMIIIATVMKNNKQDNGFDTVTMSNIFQVVRVGIWQAAVAIVIQAAISLSRKIMSSKVQLIILGYSAIIYLFINKYLIMLALMIISGFVSLHQKEAEFLIEKTNENLIPDDIPFLGIPALITFLVSYLVLYVASLSRNLNLYLMENFYRIGSLIVGGGHVVIPMLLSQFSNIISDIDILNSFSIVSLLPGPMFNISGYIGTLINGIFGGILSALSIFLPGMLLLFSSLKFITLLNSKTHLQFFLRGVSSSAIGFIFTAACLLWYEACVKNQVYNPIFGTVNIALCFILLEKYKKNLILVMIIGVGYSICLTLLKG